MAGVRLASETDGPAIGRLMVDFNTEFGDPIPPAEVTGERIGAHVASGEATVLLAGDDSGNDAGLAVLRFRPALYEDGLDSYLEELYVAPALRGQGIGRALLEEAMRLAKERGAIRMDLGTEEDDTAARALYESAGFDNRCGEPGGPVSYFYEREL